MAQTVLVTGGTGYVAGWCILELLRRGYAVRMTVRSLAREAAIRAAVTPDGVADERLGFVVADLTTDGGWDAACAGCDYVLHVASPLGTAPGGPQGFIDAARGGTLRVLRAAMDAGVKRVVMTSAAAAARPRSNKVSDETMWADPGDPQFDAYRVSKILAERAAWDFVNAGGNAKRLTTILPGAVFGPLLSRNALGSVQIIQNLLQGRPPAMPKLGFWVTDVRDLAGLHIRAMTAPEAAGERFLAAGEFQWMAEIAATLRAKLGRRAVKVPTRRLPRFLVRLLLPFNPQLRSIAPLIGRKFALTTQKARRRLGFAPRPAAETIVDCAESLLVLSQFDDTGTSFELLKKPGQ